MSESVCVCLYVCNRGRESVCVCVNVCMCVHMPVCMYKYVHVSITNISVRTYVHSMQCNTETPMRRKSQRVLECCGYNCSEELYQGNILRTLSVLWKT